MSPIKKVVNESLYNYLYQRQPLAIAWSGGVDSSTLMLFCHFNRIRYRGFSVAGPHITDFEIQRIINLREKHGLKHFFFYFDYRGNSQIAQNSRLRCFYCKSLLFSGPVKFFRRNHALIEGTNFSDLSSYRPGIEAVKSLGIQSPFADLGMSKEDIIRLGRYLGIRAVKEDSRSCILARFSYGVFLEDRLVSRIRKAEDSLLSRGLTGFRLRVLGSSEYLLQVEKSRESIFTAIRPDFDELMKNLRLHPYSLEFKSFSEISGYYD